MFDQKKVELSFEVAIPIQDGAAHMSCASALTIFEPYSMYL